MKTKQQILKAIQCCSKIGTMREQDCCSRCPYKKEEFCYKHLISDLKWYVINDVSAFVAYLENNPDGSIKIELVEQTTDMDGYGTINSSAFINGSGNYVLILDKKMK